VLALSGNEAEPPEQAYASSLSKSMNSKGI
jgi:hypothetical protein